MARPAAEPEVEIPEHVRRFCLNELHYYPIRKARLQDRRIEISDPGRQRPELERVSGGGGIDRPTERRALNLLSDIDILVDQRFTTAIEDTLAWLGEDERRFTELSFFGNKPPTYLENEVGYSVSTMYRFRNRIVRILAFRLGLIG